MRGNREYWVDSPKVKYGNCYDYSRVGQEPYDSRHIILPEIMKDNGYTTGMFGKWAGGYEGSESTPDRRGIDEFFGYICQFQAHLYYPNFLNRYSKSLGDTAVVREVMDQNVQHPMYGDDYRLRKPISFIAAPCSGLIGKHPDSLSSAFSPTRCRMPSWHNPPTR